MPASKAQQVATTERRAKVVARISRGMRPAAIARELGISEELVRQDLHRELAKRKQELDEYRDALIAQQVEELDQVRAVAWRNALTKHYQVSAQTGKVARDPETGEPLLDTAPVDRALGVIIKVQERLSKLLALDEARKIEVKAEVVTVDAFRATVEELRARVERERAAGGIGSITEGIQLPSGGISAIEGRTISGELSA